MKYKIGWFDEPNECGIVAQDIDFGEDWSGKITVYGTSFQEVTDIANKIVETLNQTEEE